MFGSVGLSGEEENKYKFMFLEQFSNSPYIQIISKEEASKSFEFSMDILKKGIEQEILIEIDPRLMGMLIFASVSSVVKYGFNSLTELTDEQLETAFCMVWRSIANI